VIKRVEALEDLSVLKNDGERVVGVNQQRIKESTQSVCSLAKDGSVSGSVRG